MKSSSDYERVPLLPKHTHDLQAEYTRALNSFILAGVIYTFAISITFVSKPAIILSAVGNDAGAAAIFTAVILSAQSLVSAVATPILASLSDSLGRPPILLLSISIQSVALLFLFYFRSSIYAVFLGSLLMATADSTAVIVLSAIADLAKSRSTAQFAKYNALVGTCFAVGPLLGGLIVAASFPSAPFLFAAAILLISFPFYLSLPNSVVRLPRFSLWSCLKTVRFKSPLPTIRQSLGESKALLILSASLVTASVADSALLAIMYLYLNASFQWESFEFGIYISANGALYIIGQLLAPRLSATLGERKLIVAGFLASALHCLIIAATNKPWALWASLLLDIPCFASLASRSAVLARQVDSEKQASLQGSVAALQSILKPFATLGAAAVFALSNKHGIPEFIFFPITVVFVISAAIADVALAHPELKLPKEVESEESNS